MKRSLFGAAAALSLFVAGSAVAEKPAQKPSDKDLFVAGDAKVGEELVLKFGCAGCHGPTGSPTEKSKEPQIPRLSGQNATYIYTQIKAFESGVRNRNAMELDGIEKMSDQDMRDVAAFLAAQPVQTGSASDKVAPLGQSIYFNGNPETNVPACSACHGPLGRGNAAAGYPGVAGQRAKYLSNQLDQYRDGMRYSKKGEALNKEVPLAQMMVTVAKNMTPEEIQAVSSFMQGLYPRQK